MAFTKALSGGKNIMNLCKLMNKTHISELCSKNLLKTTKFNQQFLNQSCNIHTTLKRYDLMEFFDDEKNWGENEVKVGRAWRIDELRIKSNTDLHQLWFVLLKEKNMLLTMEHECKDKMEVFPSPERIDKITESMENLEEVVRERNRAYYMLETGETGERPGRLVYNRMGVKFYYRSFEHIVPKRMNGKWAKSREIGFGGKAVRKFLLFHREKLYNEKRKAKNRDTNHVSKLLRRYPNTSIDLLRQKYPTVNIDKLLRDDKCRGHFVPKL